MKTMKTTLLNGFTVLTIVLTFSQALYSQFLKTYNLTSGSTECGRSLEMSLSNTFTVSGYSNASPNAGSFDWMFQKFDFSGTVMGNMLLGFPLADSCFSHTKLGSTANNILAGFYTTTWKAYTRDIASWSMVDENTFAHVNSKMLNDSFRSQYKSVVRGHLGTNYVLAGHSEANTSNGGLKKKIVAGLYDAAGNRVWLNRYSTSNTRNEAAFSICYQPFDSSYAVTGVTMDSSANGNIKRVFVMKLNLNGVPIWYKLYTPLTANYTHTKSESRRIIPMTDGSFVITGWTEEPSSGTSNTNVWVFRVNNNGFTVWSNTYGAPNITEQSYAIERNNNSTELVLTGFTTRFGNEDLVNMKLDAAGNLLWTRSTVNALGSDRGYDVKFPKKMMHSNAFYWFTGQFHKTPVNVLNSYLMKTSLNGHILPFAGCTDSLTLPKTQTILRIDTLQVSTHALYDISITPVRTAKKVKADTVCQVTGPIIHHTADNNANVTPERYLLEQNYPNPFNPSTMINFSTAADGNVSITVYDITGREVASIVNEFRNAGSYSVEFNASALPSGVYLYKLKSEGFEETKKMLLVK